VRRDDPLEMITVEKMEEAFIESKAAQRFKMN